MERIEAGIRVNAADGETWFARKLRLMATLVVAVALVGCTGPPAQVKLSMPELSKIDDGVYRGSAKDFPVLASVEVTVTSGRIAGFTILKHRTGRGKAAEASGAQVVEKQTIEIDAVSSATFSSKVILKAGENALCSGLKPEGEVGK